MGGGSDLVDTFIAKWAVGRSWKLQDELGHWGHVTEGSILSQTGPLPLSHCSINAMR